MGYKHKIEYTSGTPEYQREYYLLRTNKTNEDIREYKKTGDYTKENLKNTKTIQQKKWTDMYFIEIRFGLKLDIDI